jgi:Ras GTPase-activating-like protein IQGAP2/3
LFFLLYSCPQRIAGFFRIPKQHEIDPFLHTVHFVIYKNQYDSREEHLLLSMIKAVLSAQFESATEFSLLLCPSLAVSRLMTTYNQRDPAQHYLKNVLTERVRSLIKHKDLNLEIDPNKVNG